jgi:hypothetical protein
MTLKPSQIFDMEAPRLPFEFLCRQIPVGQVIIHKNTETQKALLLICPGEEVEHIEKRFHIELREYSSGAQ